MYIAIIIFAVILLLAIVVMINFADSDVPKSVRLIISTLVIAILAAGVYYITSPKSVVTSTSSETVPAEIPDTLIKTETIIKETVPAEIPGTPIEAAATKSLKKDTAKSTQISSVVKSKEIKKTETGTQTVISTVTPIPTDTISALSSATGTLTPKTQIINACTSWIVMSNKPTKVRYRDCCTNTDTTIEVTGSLGICAAYGFTPTGPGLLVISNSSCNCK